MKNIKRIILISVLIIVIAFGTVFSRTRLSGNEEYISIIATNFPAYDFARAVVGDSADIKMLIKPGSETHSFEPTPKDIIDIKNSQLFVYTGGESDEWIKDILNDIDADTTKLFGMMDAVDVVPEETVAGMELEEVDGETEEATEYDEHVWTSLKNAEKIIDRLKDKLIEIAPSQTEIFETNTKNYLSKLAEIDQAFEAVAKNAKRHTVIFGDRFPLRYFVDDYGLDYFAAFPGCLDQTEASSKTITFLVNKVKTEHIPVIFKIEMSNSKIADTIATETGAKILTFNSAHNISLDDFNNGLTYAEIMRKNIKVLEEALN